MSYGVHANCFLDFFSAVQCPKLKKGFEKVTLKRRRSGTAVSWYHIIKSFVNELQVWSRDSFYKKPQTEPSKIGLFLRLKINKVSRVKVQGGFKENFTIFIEAKFPTEQPAASRNAFLWMNTWKIPKLTKQTSKKLHKAEKIEKGTLSGPGLQTKIFSTR